MARIVWKWVGPMAVAIIGIALPSAPQLTWAEEPLETFISEELETLIPAFTLPESLPGGTTLTLKGSPTLGAINRILSAQFEGAYPTATVITLEAGSAAALAALLGGEVDLAAIGRPLTEAELAQGLLEVPISREKIAVFISEENPFQGDLTFDQFARTLRGQITRWAEVGGADVPIVFVDRPADSDTRQALGGYDVFQPEGLVTGATALTLEEDSTAAVVNALGPEGVGYGIASQVLDQERVRVVPMHGTLPDDPRYPYSQPRSYIYQGIPSPAVEAFLAFATGAEGQAAIATAKDIEAAVVATAELPNRTLAMRPNGQGFITGDRDGKIEFWQPNGTSAGEPLEAHLGPVTALTFTPTGERIISAGADGEVRFWDAVGNPIGEPIAAHSGPVTGLALVENGDFFTSSTDGTVRRWNSEGTPLGEPFAAHEGTVLALAPGAGDTLVTAGADGTLRQWDGAGTLQQELTGHEGAVTALAMTTDNTLISGGADGTLRQWDSTGAPQGEPFTLGEPVRAIALNGPGDALAASDTQGGLQVWDLTTGTAADPVTAPAPIEALAFSPDGTQLVTASEAEDPQGRTPTGTLAEGGGFPDLGDFDFNALAERIQALPPQLWVLIPILLLGLVLMSVLQGWRQEIAQEDEGEEDEELALEAADSPLPGGNAPAAESIPAAATPGNIPAAIAAVSPYEASHSLDHDLSRARNALGQGIDQAQAGNFQGALEWVNQAVEAADVERLKSLAAGVSLVGVGAVMARAMAQRGTILAALGRGEEALKSHDRAIALDPTNTAPWIGKGQLLLKQQQPEAALDCFNRALELDDQSGAAWQGKSTALGQLHRQEEAQAAQAQAQALGGQDRNQATPLVVAGTGALAGTAAGLQALKQFASPAQSPPETGADPGDSPTDEAATAEAEAVVDSPPAIAPTTAILAPDTSLQSPPRPAPEPDLALDPIAAADLPPEPDPVPPSPPDPRFDLDPVSEPELDPALDSNLDTEALSAMFTVNPEPRDTSQFGEDPLDDLTLFSSIEDLAIAAPGPVPSAPPPETPWGWVEESAPTPTLNPPSTPPAPSPAPSPAPPDEATEVLAPRPAPPPPPPRRSPPPPPPPRRSPAPPSLPQNPRLDSPEESP